MSSSQVFGLGILLGMIYSMLIDLVYPDVPVFGLFILWVVYFVAMLLMYMGVKDDD